MIKVKDLTKTFEEFKALDHCSINVQKGSVYGLVGENGAGKTTLLNHLAGIYKQNTGSVEIEQEEVFENNSIKQKIAYIPEELYFFAQYSVKDMAKFYKGIYKTWDDDRYEKLKEIFPINENKKVNRLSKGMKKQVAFWMAISRKPDVMILDEPIDGLDPIMRKKIWNLVVQDVAERQMTVIISSHNLRELEDICDSIAILHKGRVIVEKDLDSLKTESLKLQIAFKQDKIEELKKELDILKQEKVGSTYNLIVKGNRGDVIDICQKFSPIILDTLPLTLEEIFIYEMGGLGYEVNNILL